MVTRLRLLAADARQGRLFAGTTNRQIAGAALTVGIATALVSLISVGRELIVASTFGTDDALDAMIVSFVLPSFVVNVVGGSVATALIPTYVKVDEHEGPAAAQRVLSGIASLTVLLLLVAMGLIAASQGILLPRLASGFDAEKLALTRNLLFLFLPVVFCGGLAAVWSSVLNAKDRFALVALSQGLIPAATIVALLVARGGGIMALVTGMVVGFAMRLAALGWELTRLGIDIRPRWQGMQPHLRQVVDQYLPMVLGAALLSGTTLVEQAVAASLDAGSVAALSYGTRVVMLATGLGATALGTAVLPFFSRMVAARDWRQLRQTLRTFVLLILLVTIPITVLLSVFAEQIVTLVFQRGAFTAADTTRVAEVQAWFALQLPFFGVSLLFSRLISSLGANQLLLVQAALCLVVNAVMTYGLSRVFGVAGIALGTTLMYVVALIYLAIMAHRTLLRVEGSAISG